MKILALASNPQHAFSKLPQPHLVLITNEGIEGDAHRGATTQHVYLKKKNPTQPNLAQVHLLASQKLASLNQQGFQINPGDLGENILTDAIDLMSLPKDTLLHCGPEVILQVTGLRTPCSQIDAFRPGLQQHMWGPRAADGKQTRDAGIMAVVQRGGLLHPNDPIRIELPPEPHHSLPPV